MKKKFTFIRFLSLVMILTGCSDDDKSDEMATILNLGNDRVTFRFDEVDAPQKIGVTTDVSAYDATVVYEDGSGWLGVDEKPGYFNVSAIRNNDGAESRKATITVTAGGLTKQVSVEQRTEGAMVGSLSVSPAEGLVFEWD